MSEVFARHEVIGFDNFFDIIAMDPDRYTHDHMLGSLHNFAIESKEIGSFKSLEAKVLIIEVSVVDNGGIKLLGMSHYQFVGLLGDHGGHLIVLWIDIMVQVGDDRGELLLRLLV